MKVVVTSTRVPVSETELAQFEGADVEVVVVDGTDESVLLAATRDADAILVLVENINRRVIENQLHHAQPAAGE